MARVTVAVAVVIALAAGVWMLWPDAERDSTTTIAAAPPTSMASSTSTTAPLTTTTTDHLVDTVEEAEAVLRDLWYRWFLGIYEQDERLIRGVVFLESQVDEARQSFGTGEFLRRPQVEDITFANTELLLSSPDCLAVWTSVTLTGFRNGTSEAVHILRRVEGGWVMHTLWRHRNDLWRDDCN